MNIRIQKRIAARREMAAQWGVIPVQVLLRRYPWLQVRRKVVK